LKKRRKVAHGRVAPATTPSSRSVPISKTRSATRSQRERYLLNRQTWSRRKPRTTLSSRACLHSRRGRMGLRQRALKYRCPSKRQASPRKGQLQSPRSMERSGARAASSALGRTFPKLAACLKAATDSRTAHSIRCLRIAHRRGSSRMGASKTRMSSIGLRTRRSFPGIIPYLTVSTTHQTGLSPRYGLRLTQGSSRALLGILLRVMPIKVFLLQCSSNNNLGGIIDISRIYYQLRKHSLRWCSQQTK
jgi:hypothetical protein